MTDNALRVLHARYLLRGRDGTVCETPQEMWLRIATAVAKAEIAWGGDAKAWARRFEQMMNRLDFLPNSPTIMNAGTERGQLSACFVLPVEDSLESIFQALRDMALVQRTGGGTGFSFSRLRPAGDPLREGGTSSGPVPFIRIFDAATANIKQGGRRRGANMAVLHIDHPDIRDFIDAKQDPSALTNFNLSVAVTDAFMRAVVDGEDHALVHPLTRVQVARVPARHLWTAIIQAAWTTGDPGLLFLDAIRRADPVAGDVIEATNPCGEVPLRPYEACTLGSINLARMVPDGHLDEARLRRTVRDAVRFLDDVIEVNRYPIPAIAKATKATRKVGLGVMGFAEMLVRLGVPYDSDDAVAWAERIMRVVQDEAHDASQQLAVERGVFPAWDSSSFARDGVMMRNATCTAIAPTGTISIIAGTSAGIEPPWALAYQRPGPDGQGPMLEVNPLLERALTYAGIDPGPMMDHVCRTGRLTDVPEGVGRLFATALEISLSRHLAIQAAFQHHTDNAVSKTINLPESATVDDVGSAYVQAWRSGLKGVTVFRHGSKKAGLYGLGTAETPVTMEHGHRCDPGECEV